MFVFVINAILNMIWNFIKIIKQSGWLSTFTIKNDNRLICFTKTWLNIQLFEDFSVFHCGRKTAGFFT